MGSILNSLDDISLPLFFIVFLATYIFALSFLLKKVKAKRLERKNKFIDTFIKGISENTIENSNDLLNVYSGITNLSPEDLNNKQGLNKWLREILAKLVSREVGQDMDSAQINKIKQKISEFIATNESISPFADLPDTERNIINDLSSYNKLGDRKSIDRKINELSSVIITRYEQQKKIESLNRWSIPLAVIGAVLTIFFGIMSLVV
ncbi:hypothetical protein [Alistipes finegoldii]|uniref:hypothetical protein n=1 Tax=Alistipes finegoldii TaxID=214856 RepID=UPI00308023CA